MSPPLILRQAQDEREEYVSLRLKRRLTRG